MIDEISDKSENAVTQSPIDAETYAELEQLGILYNICIEDMLDAATAAYQYLSETNGGSCAWNNVLDVLKSQLTPKNEALPQADQIVDGCVEVEIEHANHKIKAVIKHTGRRYDNCITKDNKSPYIFESKLPLYKAEKSRDEGIRDWIKQKFEGLNKATITSILTQLREAAAEKQELLDRISESVTQNQSGDIIVSGYEGQILYTTSKTGMVKPVTGAIACAIMDKLDIVSYQNALWEYKSGVYTKSNLQVREEIARIFQALKFNGNMRSMAADIEYLMINSHHTGANPFNKFQGIPCANGVVVIDFNTGEESIISYTPNMKFTYKSPVSSI